MARGTRGSGAKSRSGAPYVNPNANTNRTNQARKTVLVKLGEHTKCPSDAHGHPHAKENSAL